MGSDVESKVLVDDSDGFVDVAAGLIEAMLTRRRSGLLGSIKIASGKGVFQVLISLKSHSPDFQGLKGIIRHVAHYNIIIIICCVWYFSKIKKETNCI